VAWALAAGRPARLFEDQFRTPVDAASLADLLERLLRRGGRGLFHAGGPERLSRLDLGRRVARALGLDPALLVPMRQGDLPGAPRPVDVSLDSARARAELGWEPRAVDEALREQRAEPEATSGRS
jgi:dTDP-4-dehydrorhamnose reductase